MTIRGDHIRKINCPRLGRNQPIVCSLLINEVETRRIKGVPFSCDSLFDRKSPIWNTWEFRLLNKAYKYKYRVVSQQLGRLLWKVLREDSEKYGFKPASKGKEYTW